MPLKASIWPEAVSVPATTYQAARNSIFAARRSSGDAVMIGDSITEMGDWDAIFPDYRIINRGVYSDNTAGLLARTDELSRVDADIAFVMIGTNDFTIRLDANGTFGRYNRIIKALAPKR
ncbi:MULTISPECIES: GDSL-type esterase/lipase family protein [unclassified Mesorhizobium]